ncbi:hypothetical protein H8958_012795, partial [Nasalis larvatus]
MPQEPLLLGFIISPHTRFPLQPTVCFQVGGLLLCLFSSIYSRHTDHFGHWEK